MSQHSNGAMWKLVSRTVGLMIVGAVLVLLFIAEIARRPVDWLTVDILLVIAAYLLGIPSLVVLLKRSAEERNGSG